MSVPKKLNRKTFCIATLRRASYRWPPRNEARNKAKVGRNQYICAECGPNIKYGKKDTQLDHINPIIPVETGWQGLDMFAERLLCEAEGFQLLCRMHHDLKTSHEKELRKYYRKLNKEKEEC